MSGAFFGTLLAVYLSRKQDRSDRSEGGIAMFTPKGFYTGNSYVGFLPDGSRMAFPTSDEYIDYIEECQEDAA